MQYKCFRDSNLFALRDESSVIGIQSNNDNYIVKENIIDGSQEVITYHEAVSPLYTFVVNQKANALLAGEDNDDLGRVVQ